jgi:hypothetical protein
VIFKRSYTARWLTKDDEFHEQEFTSRPVADGHMRALARNPKVKAAGLFETTRSKS